MPLFTKYRKFTVAIEWLLSGYCVAIEWLLSGYWSCPLKHSLNVGISKRKSYCLYQNYCTTWCQAESYFTMADLFAPSGTPNLILKKYQPKNLGTLPGLLHHLTFPNFDGRCVRLFLFNVKLGGEGGCASTALRLLFFTASKVVQ